jgi:hypothetical protein
VADVQRGGVVVARVYFNGTWFNSVRSQSWLERDYEELVFQNCSDLFPYWIPVRFKADVVGEDGVVKRPDLALIDPRYRKWCVVEIELSHHDIYTHVLPQIDVFCSGKYDDGHALYLAKQDLSLDLAKLTQMMAGLPPDVMVVVDRPDTSWKRHLRALGALLGVVEPFRGPNDEIMFRVNGDQLELPGDVLSRCSRALRRFWKVHSPAALPAPAGDDELLEIWHEGTPTVWRRHNFAGSVMLSVDSRGDVLDGLSLVDLVEHDDGSLRFQAVAKE